MKSQLLPFAAAELGILTARKKLERLDGTVWLAQALEAIRTVARRQEHFTSDDVWAQLGPDEGGETFRSQMGNALRDAKAAGYCTTTGTFKVSTRAPRHRCAIRVWRSRIYA